MAAKIPFPINTATSCLLKWNWSTIWLSRGKTNSCHRNYKVDIPLDNFDSFHNLPYKLDHRRSMLKGEWPHSPNHLGCGYCKQIEDAGGRSDRQYMTSTQLDQTPDQLLEDPTAVEVDPAVLEIFLSKTCNLACTYCVTVNSSKIETEAKKYSEMKEFNDFYFAKLEDTLPAEKIKQYKELCIDWLQRKGTVLRRFHVLGGEPFYTPEFKEFVDVWRHYPNPNLIFSVISNVNVKPKMWQQQIDNIVKLVQDGCIERFDLTASIDCWGPAQEYVRSGFDCKIAEENVLYALSKPEITLNLNHTHSLMSLGSYTKLLQKKKEWEQISNKEITLSGQIVGSKHVDPRTLGGQFFTNVFKDILREHPRQNWGDKEHMKNISGVLKVISESEPDVARMKHFVTVYDELDRRRGTDWRKTFPEIEQEINKYLIV